MRVKAELSISENPWTEYGSYEEATVGLSNLTVKFREIKTKLGYSEPDATTRALTDCRMIINTVILPPSFPLGC